MKAFQTLMVLALSFAAHAAVNPKATPNSTCSARESGPLWANTASKDNKKPAKLTDTQTAELKTGNNRR
jgi:hypothetical protein